MDLICAKCNYVLNRDSDVDDGVCPKCQGMVYQEGEVIDDSDHKRFLDLMDETMAKLRLFKPSNEPKN